MIISKVAHRIILSLFMVCLLFFFVSPVSAQPMLPHAFYGSVTIGGQPAPLGTLVEARGDNIIPDTDPDDDGPFEGNPICTTVVGKYGSDDPSQNMFYVQGTEELHNGETIEFYINGVKADQIFENPGFQSGGLTELNLTVASAPPVTCPPTLDGGGGLSGGAVAGIAVGALLLGALVVWLIMRRQKGSDNASPSP